MGSFKEYLIEVMSTGDDNAIGGIIDRAKKNLTQLSKQQKPLSPVCTSLLSALSNLDENPSLLYIDGYSVVDYLQRLCNPKVDINTLKTINDAMLSFDGDSDS